jgi:DNA polymerase
MIIGEAPGTKEDEHGIPFCGDSGKLLDMMFETIGLARDKNIFISNTIYWRPPANRNPNFEELAICYPFMAKMIELLNPKLIILVGAVAAKNLLGYIKPMAQLRQQIIPFSHPKTNQNFPTITIYHPAFLLRQPQQKKNMWLDLQFIKKYMLEYNIKT